MTTTPNIYENNKKRRKKSSTTKKRCHLAENIRQMDFERRHSLFEEL